MSAKKLIIAALIGSLISACGGNTPQAPLPGDGTYDSGLQPSGDDYYGDTTSPSGDYTDPVGSPDASLGEGFVLKGVVLDKSTNKPLARAKVSIGASTQLTSEDGSFEFANIRDTQVWVTVSLDGYTAIDQYNVAFTNDKPTADKEFLLASNGTGSSGSSGSDEPAFSHEGTFGSGKFKSVSAMVVSDDVVFVLGVVDGFLWLNRNSVVAFDAASGEELVTFNKTGALSHLPKDADSLKVQDGEVYVSNGETAWIFTEGGEFVKKSTGARYAAVKEVTDEDRDITYTIKGAKVEVDDDGDDSSHSLEEARSLKALGLDSDGALLVLDGGNAAVHRYTFE